MREIRTPGSVRGAARKGRPYRDDHHSSASSRSEERPQGVVSTQGRHSPSNRLGPATARPCLRINAILRRINPILSRIIGKMLPRPLLGTVFVKTSYRLHLWIELGQMNFDTYQPRLDTSTAANGNYQPRVDTSTPSDDPYQRKRSAEDANSRLAGSQVDANLVARADCLTRSALTQGHRLRRAASAAWVTSIVW